MRIKSIIKLFSIGLLAFSLLTIVACGGEEQAEERAVEETTPPPPPPPPPAVKKRTTVKPAVKEETPEEFEAVEEEEVETVAEVQFIPHRFSYTDVESKDEPLHVNMKAFDVAPRYGKKCEADVSDKCTHDAVQTYLKTNIDFPDEAKDFDDLVEYVSFVVKADGEVDKSNIQILPLDPQCHTCAAEALELIRDMGKWTPAQKGGTPVDARVTVPIRFSISD